jgi:hypothetical protein
MADCIYINLNDEQPAGTPELILLPPSDDDPYWDIFLSPEELDAKYAEEEADGQEHK